MHSEAAKGSLHRAIVVAALLTLGSGCTLLPATGTASPTSSTSPATTPTPSASPSPSASATTQLLATSPPFHGGEVGVVYSPVSLQVTGGAAPYAWSVSSGSVPNGLSLSSEGQVAGTPTKAGHFTFIATVADSAGGKDSITGSISIVAALTANFLRLCGASGKCTVEQGCVSVCGGFGYQGGGAGPYSYNLTGGSVPPGTHQYGLSLAGTFTTTGVYNFKATVTDGYGATASLSPAFTVAPHLSFAGGTVTCPYNGCGGNSGHIVAMLFYSGGLGGNGNLGFQVSGWTPTCDFTGCGPPPAPTGSAAQGGVYIVVPGSSGGNGYHAYFTLTLNDGHLCGAGTYCSAAATVNVVVQAG